MNTKDKIFLAIGSVAIIAAAGIGSKAIFNDVIDANYGITVAHEADSDITITDNDNSNSDSSSSSGSASESIEYEDGNYSAIVPYSVPHGYENDIDVSIIIEDGVITSVNADHSYTDRESGMYIDSFDSYLESKVEGQSIADISYSRIGGASLTTDGFVEALELIRDDAEV